ncbi:MAG: HAMP domain-containing histidine kinase [Firmicutes bacterium]|nr:HAMP domain-containing histidine kinase [Bacillota bacterium]
MRQSLYLVILFSVISAALGAYLFNTDAGNTYWIGLAIFLASTAALLASLYGWWRWEKEIEALHGQLTDFLEGRKKSPLFSVNDDSFALLENAVVELENRLLLERENRLKENQKNADFIADVSHQLKTPLAALKLYVEMDQRKRQVDRNDRPDAATSLEYISKQLLLIERMEKMIYSLLRLEKLRADAYEMQFAHLDLFTLIQEIVTELQFLYPHKKFTTIGRTTMRCDAYWISEALKNILKNSCEHTPPSGQIHLFLENTERAIAVTVEDNGGGVPEKELPWLLQRFYRSSRPASGEGAGLGLAIARAIVEKHHGIISAENTATGLKITLTFPRLDGILKIGQ